MSQGIQAHKPQGGYMNLVITIEEVTNGWVVSVGSKATLFKSKEKTPMIEFIRAITGKKGHSL